MIAALAIAAALVGAAVYGGISLASSANESTERGQRALQDAMRVSPTPDDPTPSASVLPSAQVKDLGEPIARTADGTLKAYAVKRVERYVLQVPVTFTNTGIEPREFEAEVRVTHPDSSGPKAAKFVTSGGLVAPHATSLIEVTFGDSSDAPGSEFEVEFRVLGPNGGTWER
ncbi:hypothetical protein ACX6XY_28350 [Streptomyces sp. O3]